MGSAKKTLIKKEKEKEMENETKEQMRSIYETIKKQDKKIALQQEEMQRLYELIDYKEGQRRRLVSDLGKVEKRNRQLVAEVHHLRLGNDKY